MLPGHLRNLWVGAAALVVPLSAQAQHRGMEVGVQMRNVDFHGYSKNTPDHGLIVFMPDYRKTPPPPDKTP